MYLCFKCIQSNLRAENLAHLIFRCLIYSNWQNSSLFPVSHNRLSVRSKIDSFQICSHFYLNRNQFQVLLTYIINVHGQFWVSELDGCLTGGNRWTRCWASQPLSLEGLKRAPSASLLVTKTLLAQSLDALLSCYTFSFGQ